MLSRAGIASCLRMVLPLLATTAFHAQVTPGAVADSSDARFDVTSVKESPIGSIGPRALTTRPGGVTVRNRTVVEMIQWAYNLPARDILGGPGWSRSRRFDVEGRVGGNGATRRQLQSMLRSLLADRFALNAVYERKIGPIYALTPDRRDRTLGPAMRPSTATCKKAPPEGILPTPDGLKQGILEREHCGVAIASHSGMVFFLSGMRATTADIARSLSPYLDRPVVDRTRLDQEFDFVLTIAPPGPDVSASAPLTGAEIFTAIREELGLRLQPEDGEVEVLVIRGVALPTEN
jgi:uncharacterized protein (TIGR03435 family)